MNKESKIAFGCLVPVICLVGLCVLMVCFVLFSLLRAHRMLAFYAGVWLLVMAFIPAAMASRKPKDK